MCTYMYTGHVQTEINHIRLFLDFQRNVNNHCFEILKKKIKLYTFLSDHIHL